MKAVVIREHGSFDKLVIEDRPIPSLKPASRPQYLIRVKACGLNHLDTWVRRGVPGHRFPLPMVPGSDIAGLIEASVPGQGPGHPQFKVGDRVVINPAIYCGTCEACLKEKDHLCVKWGLLGETADGGCQEYIVSDERALYIIPDHMSFEQAACVPIAYVTAYEMLVNKARAQTSQTVLIHAAGSAVSVACIQIAKLLGLHIIVTSTSEQKLARARALGAHRFIDTSRNRFVDDVKNLTGKAGVDIVVDHVGAATIMDSIRCLKKGGVLLSCGATAGSDINIDWKHVFFKNISLLGSTYGPRPVFTEVLSRFGSKQLTPVIDNRVQLTELGAAHEAIEARRTFGKIVVKI